jgi:hypothetical protein
MLIAIIRSNINKYFRLNIHYFFSNIWIFMVCSVRLKLIKWIVKFAMWQIKTITSLPRISKADKTDILFLLEDQGHEKKKCSPIISMSPNEMLMVIIKSRSRQDIVK